MASTRPPQSGNNKNPKKKPPQAQPITSAPQNNPANSTRPGEPKRPASAESRPATNRNNSSSAANRRPRNAPPPPPKKNNLPVYLIGGVIAVVIAAVALILVLNNGSDNTAKSGTNDTTNTNSSAGSTVAIAADPSANVETFDNQGQDHIKPGTKHVPYNSDPPTSGPHFESPLPWGVYQQPLADEYAVHNLEHGGIVMYYDCTKDCEQVINQLTVYGRRYAPNVFTGIIVAPRQNMPNGAKIALTAWRTRLLLKSLDTTKINDFIKNYFNKGPESAG